ncbi:MAG: serine--tRNA ligase [Planctomycetota bacterium]|nr:MAG: serine--tRNA ligase [Planctomycetota bacterium]
MLDAKWVREHADLVRDAATRKRMDPSVVDAFLENDRDYRALLQQVEGLRADLKTSSSSLGKMKPEEREVALVEQRAKKAELKTLEKVEQELRAVVRGFALRLPMPPATDVQDGLDDRGNVEISVSGPIPQKDFEIQTHDDLGEKLGIIDIKRGVKIAGSRNYLLLGDAARLERAVLNLALDHMMKRDFEMVSVPSLVNRACMEGTGYFPGGEEQAYLAERDDLALIGTSEVPLTSIHSGETLDFDRLPLRRVALSPCFRREAGTYGKDTKGLYRVHQFWKVEQVVLGPSDEVWSLEEHKRMLRHATDLMDLLELPYRVVNVCTGDLGQGQVQKFDIETWMPSRNSYGETHSASRFHDFQTRRLNLRYRPEGKGKPQFCHSLNNTVIASPRVLIALMENHQQADGSIRIPEALQPYLGGESVLRGNA